MDAGAALIEVRHRPAGCLCDDLARYGDEGVPPALPSWIELLDALARGQWATLDQPDVVAHLERWM